MQTHICSSLRQKNMVFGCSFLLFLAVFCCFLQDSTHFLPFISKILVETIISDINWRYWGENKDANPYFQQDKKNNMVFCWFFAFFYSFFCFFQDSSNFLSFISKILVETTISSIDLRYRGESNDANPYSQQFKTKEHGFWLFYHAPINTVYFLKPGEGNLNDCIWGVSRQLPQRGARASKHAVSNSSLRYQNAFEKIMG